MPENANWNETVARYQREMRRLYEKSELPPPETTAQTEAVAPTEEAEAFLPTEEAEALAPTEAVEVLLPTEEAAPAAPRPPLDAAPPFGSGADGTAQTTADRDARREPQADETDVGTLVVRLNSARGTIPIVGATVTVFRKSADGDTLLYMGETNESGESPVWSLATKNRELSLEPGEAAPYVNYAVQANADGYVTFRSEGVSVFGGVKTVQRISMSPLPEPTAVTEPFLETRTANRPPELN